VHSVHPVCYGTKRGRDSKDQLQGAGGALRAAISGGATLHFCQRQKCSESLPVDTQKGFNRRRRRPARTVGCRHAGRRNRTFLPMAETKRVRVRTTPRVICRHERRQIDRRCCSSFSGANPLCWALHRFFHATHRIRRWAWRCRLIRENSSLPCLFPEEMPLLRPAAHESVKAVPETDSFAQLLPVNLLSH